MAYAILRALSDVVLVVAALVFLALLEITGYGLFAYLVIGDTPTWMQALAVEFPGVDTFRLSAPILLIMLFMVFVLSEYVRRSPGGGAGDKVLGIVALAVGVILFLASLELRMVSQTGSMATLDSAFQDIINQGPLNTPLSLMIFVFPIAGLMLVMAGLWRIVRPSRRSEGTLSRRTPLWQRDTVSA